MRNVTGDPRAGTLEGELFDITPYAGAYVRYFVRHPTTQAMPRKVKTAFTATDEDNAITRIHDVAFIPKVQRRGSGRRDAGRRRDLDHAPAGPNPVRVRRARQRRLSEGHRGVHADLRPPGLAARQPRPRPDQGPDRQDRDRRVPRAGRGGARGRLGRRSATSRSTEILFEHDEAGQRAGAAEQAYASPNGDSRAFDRFVETNVQRQRQQRLLDRRGQGAAWRPDPRAAPRAGRDHARLQRRLRPHDRAPEPRPALGARRVRLRGVAGARRARARRRRRGRDHRRRQLPGHRLVQARDHQLDGPQPGDPGPARRRWRSTIR